MSLIGVLIAYQEETLLPGCLASIVDVVDRIIVVDGAYQQFPHPEGVPQSTDATREIARCYGAEWIDCPDGGWPDQMTKRSAYLVGEDGDWYLHLDADERLKGELPLLEALTPGQTYGLRVMWASGYFVPWAARLFQHRGRMEYRGAHCALFSNDELITNWRSCEHLEGAWLLHLTDMREPERQRAKQKYYVWQRKNEREFRTEWSL